MKNTLKILLGLALILSLLAFAACDNADKDSTEESSTAEETSTELETEITDFDYASADISQYIQLSSSEYSDITVTLGAEYKFSDSAVDDYINAELFDYKELTDEDAPQITDQAIKLGDSAFIYYTGYLNDKAFDGGSNVERDDDGCITSSPYELSIGSGTFIDGFEDGLIGLIPNTTSEDAPFDLHVTFPESYGSEELAGQAVVFKVWVEYIVQYTIPEFNDDFVANVLEYEGSAEEYRAEVAADLELEYSEDAESAAFDAAVSMLIEAAEILEYPQQSVDYWYASIMDEIEYYMEYYAYYGYSFDSLDDFVISYFGLDEDEDWQAMFTDYAKDTVAMVLVYYSIADQEGITVTEQDITDYATELSEYYSQYGYTPEEIIEEFGEASLKQSVIFERVEELISSNITIEFEEN